jgi:D-tyrosyl-tRNA(Tyr) deacylase
MRAVVQRVSRASVTVGDDVVGAIGAGLCVLVGVTHDDDAGTAGKLADKLWHLRLFDDAAGVMNVSASDARAEVLVVSQFTLYGNTEKGRRPSWLAAARPEHAEPLVDAVVARLRELGATVATGRFRTDMEVELVNHGPVTLIVEV